MKSRHPCKVCHHTTPKGLLLRPPDRCLREGSVGSHPAGSNAALPEQPDLFRLSRARLQVPFALRKGDIHGHPDGKEENHYAGAPSSFTPLSTTQSQHLLRPRPLCSISRFSRFPPASSTLTPPARPLPSSRASSRPLPLRRPRNFTPNPSRASFQRAPPPVSLPSLPTPPATAVAGIPLTGLGRGR